MLVTSYINSLKSNVKKCKAPRSKNKQGTMNDIVV